MKWHGYSSDAANRMSKFLSRITKNKGIYYLLMIVSLGLALGASWKWHG